MPITQRALSIAHVHALRGGATGRNSPLVGLEPWLNGSLELGMTPEVRGSLLARVSIQVWYLLILSSRNLRTVINTDILTESEQTDSLDS